MGKELAFPIYRFLLWLWTYLGYFLSTVVRRIFFLSAQSPFSPAEFKGSIEDFSPKDIFV